MDGARALPDGESARDARPASIAKRDRQMPARDRARENLPPRYRGPQLRWTASGKWREPRSVPCLCPRGHRRTRQSPTVDEVTLEPFTSIHQQGSGELISPPFDAAPEHGVLRHQEVFSACRNVRPMACAIIHRHLGRPRRCPRPATSLVRICSRFTHGARPDAPRQVVRHRSCRRVILTLPCCDEIGASDYSGRERCARL